MRIQRFFIDFHFYRESLVTFTPNFNLDKSFS